MSHDPRTQAVSAYFERLTPAELARLGEVYAPHASFKDPFNEVHGVDAIRAIFEHMYRALEAPRFVVTRAVSEGDDAFLTWDFHFVARGTALTVRGATHLRFAPDGRVAVHRDYWDAAEELYEKLPVLGALMRWLRRRAQSR